MGAGKPYLLYKKLLDDCANPDLEAEEEAYLRVAVRKSIRRRTTNPN
jgi:hypothetical protein